MVSGPKTTTRMIPGVLAQPGPQRGIRVGRRVGQALMPLSGGVLPGDPAREPLTDPQYPLEVSNGRPPALRA